MAMQCIVCKTYTAPPHSSSFCNECEAGIEVAESEARLHSATCPSCYAQIIDDEGNPGLFGEACARGLVLLVSYCKAIGAPVPDWVKR